MSILQYMNETGMRFWRSVPVSLLLAIGEWAVLLCCVQSCAEESFADGWRKFIHPAMLLGCVALQFWHMNVVLHCLTLMLMCTVYICLLARRNWLNGVLESCACCLFIELGKSLCRDGLLARGLSRGLGIECGALNALLLTLNLLWLTVLCLYFLRRKRRKPDLPITTFQVFCLLFPVYLYLAVRFFQYTQVERLDNAQWFGYDLMQYAVAMCALVVMGTMKNMLYSQMELNALSHQYMLARQQQQIYEIQRDSIDFINRRYHDLKHAINGIELILANAGAHSGADIDQVEAYIQSLKDGIAPYGSIQKTGSPVMDVLLFQRMQECQHKAIRLLSSIDASHTGFINAMDLSTLFGNAMDNAIEAVQALDDPALREIRVKIGTSDSLLLMRFYNRYQGTCKQVVGGFQTTKADGGHGYGLSSIEAIAEKYGGTAQTECANGEFALHVLIPLPETEQDGDPK